MAQDLLVMNPPRRGRRLKKARGRRRICAGKRKAEGLCYTKKVQALRRRSRTLALRAERDEKMGIMTLNPRGIKWSGIYARLKPKKSGGKMRRYVRVRSGRTKRAFFRTSRLGRRVSGQFARIARRAKRRGCRSRLGSSMLKCRGKTRCFTARGRRVCFKVKK